MAEGFVRHLLSNEKNIIDSAGIKADGLNKLAVIVMSELNIDISAQASKEISSINLNKFNLIVTVCDNARSVCPIIPEKQTIHKNFLDPALARGEINDRLIIYRNIRDEIQIFVKELLNNYDKICQELN